MAAVYLGRLVGPAGFSRVVAIKRLHEQYAQDPDFVSMFLDEARIAARIRHPNVVPTLDVVVEQGELFLVLEYVEGESLAALIRRSNERGERIPLPIVLAVFIHVLHGLDAAHEATDDAGRPLGIIHRDVSPQNVMVGTDGVARVLDFGVAKAFGRAHHTKSGATKGKIAYMAPEQIVMKDPLTRAADIYATSITLWEALVGRRYLESDSDAHMLHALLYDSVPAPRSAVPDLPPALDAIVLRGVERVPSARFATAREMAVALAGVDRMATPMEVADWVRATAADALGRRAAHVADIAAGSGTAVLHPSWPPTAGGSAEAREAKRSGPSLPFGSSTASLERNEAREAASVSGARPARSDPPPASRRQTVSATMDLAEWANAAAEVFELGAARAREIDHPPIAELPDGMMDEKTIVDLAEGHVGLVPAVEDTVLLPIPQVPARAAPEPARASDRPMPMGVPMGAVMPARPAAPAVLVPSTSISQSLTAAIPWRRGRGARAALILGLLVALAGSIAFVAFLASPSARPAPTNVPSAEPPPSATAPPLTTAPPAPSIDEVRGSPSASSHPAPPAAPTAPAPRPRPATTGAAAEPKPAAAKSPSVSHDGLFDR
jgi:serine/threonine-protein kinase